MVETMLTTIDNPYSPFTEFDEWDTWDRIKGYNTSAFLARVIFTSEDLSDLDYEIAYDLAIEEILKENVLGLYVKTTRPV